MRREHFSFYFYDNNFELIKRGAGEEALENEIKQFFNIVDERTSNLD